MKWIVRILLFAFMSQFLLTCKTSQTRITKSFNKSWKFYPGDIANGQIYNFDDSQWRVQNVPHDWSIEGEFSESNPVTPSGGALPGGIGWYRKKFTVNKSDQDKKVYIQFDGVYMNSEVWINGNYLGKRPYGYISFRYDLTPYLKYGDRGNIIAVRVDNSLQPNSRWYSGSGIIRNVWFVMTSKVAVDQWGTYITTPFVSNEKARVVISAKVRNSSSDSVGIQLTTSIYNDKGKKVYSTTSEEIITHDSIANFTQEIDIEKPSLWSVDHPDLYEARIEVSAGGRVVDEYNTTFGIRSFEFDVRQGFILNGEKIKIKGVCNHHDLGCLGAAVNTRAIERQLEILKKMGCNAIRTSHNPPAPELLDLCDKMGFLVMDEAFDMWKIAKTKYDYSNYWDEWHERDLSDFILRDRNHPSVIIWSIGNEIMEQRDTSGIQMVQDLYHFVKAIDSTRPVTTANNPPGMENNLTKPMILDLIGYNYFHYQYEQFPELFPNQKFLSTETASALATRGHYDMPSDTIKRWPIQWDIPFKDGNPDNTVSAYDHVSAPWGSTHEESWKIIKKHDFLSGCFIWTGFDYLGEPTPYWWPSRSSYFGIIDLAGFPKDSYYMYQSEWTTKPVLHIFPHWNWKEGDTVDIWAYFNCDEVELFLNNESKGTKRKTGDELHEVWRLKYIPGTLRAVGRTAGKEVLVKEIKTAGKPANISLNPDRSFIVSNGKDLSFVTVTITDSLNNPVPYADNLVNFQISGEGIIVGVDNGCQTSHEPFNADYRKAFNGKCLVVVQSTATSGKITLKANSKGMKGSSVIILTRKK